MGRRVINKITVKYRFPIPRIEKLLEVLAGAQIFNKLEVKSGYHHIKIREGDEWKTAFKIRQGLYEKAILMPTQSLMKLMREVLKHFLRVCIVV